MTTHQPLRMAKPIASTPDFNLLVIGESVTTTTTPTGLLGFKFANGKIEREIGRPVTATAGYYASITVDPMKQAAIVCNNSGTITNGGTAISATNFVAFAITNSGFSSVYPNPSPMLKGMIPQNGVKFSPSGKWVVVLNGRLDPTWITTATVYQWSPTNGLTNRVDYPVPSANTSGEIIFHPSGKCVLLTNIGSKAASCFKFNDSDGSIDFTQQLSIPDFPFGSTNFTFNHNGTMLVAASGNNIATSLFDPDYGGSTLRLVRSPTSFSTTAVKEFSFHPTDHSLLVYSAMSSSTMVICAVKWDYSNNIWTPFSAGSGKTNKVTCFTIVNTGSVAFNPEGTQLVVTSYIGSQTTQSIKFGGLFWEDGFYNYTTTSPSIGSLIKPYKPVFI